MSEKLDRPAKLLKIAREIASGNPDFHAVQGPGLGDHATGAFMRSLRERATVELGNDYSEQKICGPNSFAVDFYFPREQTIVEVALGLPNPASEFEKDVLKAIMSQECGHRVKRLYFISRPGAAKKCNQPGRTAVREWAKKKHGLAIEVHDLEGEPRKRKRRLRSRSEMMQP